MAAVLKVTYQSEFRRCRLEEADISYEGLCRWLSRLFPEVNCYCAKYVDDEGDRCTLCDASFSDFLELSSSPGGGQVELGKKMILRLELQPEEPKPEPVPKFKVVHEGITCDGCQAAPIMGDRFKCGSCPDYDLCDACYKKRPEVHGGDFANHDFHRVDRQSLCGIARTIWKQKRKESKKEHGQKERGPCPGAGCPYKVTWHRSHCCHSCSKGAGHGKKCERVRKEEDVIPPPVLPEDSEKMHQEEKEQKLQVQQVSHISIPAVSSEPEMEAAAVDALEVKDEVHSPSAPTLMHFVFPVEVDDGRTMQIEWNEADNLQLVAREFLMRNRMPADQETEIVRFMVHAEQLTKAEAAAKAEAVANVAVAQTEDVNVNNEDTEPEKPKLRYQAEIQQLYEMGFHAEPQTLEDLLHAVQGNLDKAIDLL
eukprot:CAMPEP_0181445006 /NCGR_PEP_ID=MMETSP1110-20121109/25367_1 /TAXON_ID=174948 /ORGANISM="Symbiodinium sp., Strain CCMP421" /LENGTH=423 /DNA_ID=CAMNT_0023569041 /DNA_START=50 /DNA_END=1321 /DNA_ORIENTATION=+